MSLDIRAYTEPDIGEQTDKSQASITSAESEVLDYHFIFDTETTTDPSQKLRFGVYKAMRANGTEIERGIFYNEAALTEIEIALIEDIAQDSGRLCMPVSEWVDIFYHYTHTKKALVIGHNLPFDFGALTQKSTNAKDAFRGGFTVKLCDCPYDQCFKHPSLRVKHLSKTKALFNFQQQKNGNGYKGRFLDTATIAKAVAGMSDVRLKSVAKKLKTEHQKIDTDEHGATLSADYLTYAMNDIDVTYDVYVKLQALYDLHQLTTPIWKILSEASLGKAYLKDMGVPEFRKQHSYIPKEIYGIVMSTFYGARVEVAYAKAPIEVVYCDFKSEYPTVNALMDLQSLLLAEHIDIQNVTADIRAFAGSITLADLQHRDTWKKLAVIVKIQPSNDILPVRADFGPDTKNIALCNVVRGAAMWYTLADVVASKLLTGKTPHIIEALAFIPEGRITTIPKAFFGDREHTIDMNAGDDLFTKVIDVRTLVKRQMKQYTEGSAEYDLLDAQQLGMKLTANGTSYGIHAEFIAEEQSERRKPVHIFTQNGDFVSKPAAMEKPGKYFSPIATFITAAGRLLLVVAELLGRDRGIRHAMCDTDSMIFARPDGMERETFYAHVDAILDWFQALYPYGEKGELFELEGVNFHLQKSKQREPLYFYGVSSKRYVIYNKVSSEADSCEGAYRIRKFSAHGTGTWGKMEGYTSPNDIPQPWPEIYLEDVKAGEGSYRLCNGGGHRWLYDLWYRAIVATEQGKRYIAYLEELEIPARIQVSITTPELLRRYQHIPGIRPFAFFDVFPSLTKNDIVLRGHSDMGIFDFATGESTVQSAAPIGVTLYAARNDDTIYRSDTHEIVTFPPKTANEVMRGYFGRKEYKMSNPSGTRYLERRAVVIAATRFIGKESNELKIDDNQESMGVLPEPEPQEYGTPIIDLSAFDTAPLAAESEVSQRTIQRLKRGQSVNDNTLQKALNGASQSDVRTCKQCGFSLSGKQKQFCSDTCRKKQSRDTRLSIVA